MAKEGGGIWANWFIVMKLNPILFSTSLSAAVSLSTAFGAPAQQFTSADTVPDGLTASDWARILQQVPSSAQQAYLKASNTGESDTFGVSVAVSGDTVVVGASGESSNATGVNGNQSDNSALFSGAAYVFVRSGTNWTQQAYLKASNTGAFDFFGLDVAVSGDTVVVGALGEDSNAKGVDGNQADNSAIESGAAYVFVRSGTNWSQQAYLKASNAQGGFPTGDVFGQSVAVSGDTVVVGASGESSNATGVNGNQADNTAQHSGAAYVFVRSGTNWSQQAYLKASNTEAEDQFGWSVALSGDTVVVGAPIEDSDATGVNGTGSDPGVFFNSGAAYVFVRSGTNWSQQAYLKASNTEAFDGFGFPVAVSEDTVVVGAIGEDSNATGVNGNQSDNSAPHSGAAYVFVRSGTNWTQQAYLKASNTEESDEFGRSVALSGDKVVVGAWSESSNATGVNGNQGDNSAQGSGAAYVFVRHGTNWRQQAYLKASNTESPASRGFPSRFGQSVAMSGDTVVVGAPLEDSNATGVNGNQSDNSAPLSGAAYVFLTVNRPPLCALGIACSLTLPNVTNAYVIALDGVGACVVLDGSGSSDPDDDPLQFTWMVDGAAIASGARVTNCLTLGCHTVSLVVSDERQTSQCETNLCVLTAGQAVEPCIALLDRADLGGQNKRPLIATLNAAAASFARGDFVSATSQLEAFQHKVRAKLAPTHPIEAAALIECARKILDAIECAATLLDAGASSAQTP